MYFLVNTPPLEPLVSSQYDLKIVDRGRKASNQINKQKQIMSMWIVLDFNTVASHLGLYNVCKSRPYKDFEHTQCKKRCMTQFNQYLLEPCQVRSEPPLLSSEKYLCMFRCVWSLLLLVQCSPVPPVTFGQKQSITRGGKQLGVLMCLKQSRGSLRLLSCILLL